MHAFTSIPVRPGRLTILTGPTAYVVPKRDGQRHDHVVIIEGDTMIGDRPLPAGYIFPGAADDALRHMGFRRVTDWLPRGSRGGHRCGVEPAKES